MRSDPAAKPGDNDLMLMMQRGRKDALGELYDRYCDRAFRVARAVSVDDAGAEEAVQEGFVSVWRSRATYRPDRPTAAAWVLSVVRHRAIDIARRHGTAQALRAQESTLLEHRSGEDLAAEAADRADARDLKSSLARLPEPQREVIVLAFYGQLTHTEIADELGLPIGTVKGRIRLGLHKLRDEIERQVA